MTIYLSIVVWLPLAAGVLGALVPRRMAAWPLLGASVLDLAYVVAALVKFDPGAAGLQFVTNDKWIPDLGIRWALGLDGISIWMVALTAALWVPAVFVAWRRELERPRLFFFNMALAETATLGLFCAQDLALFVVFFDLTLVPFYFLIGAWGELNRVYATTKFVIYTLAGSLLMLAGVVAIGVISTPAGGHISFLFSDLHARALPAGSQHWIFWLLVAAFFVKAPLFPLHGWMPDTYRATPIPVLMVLSAVISKFGPYGLLRVVLPLLPEATRLFQEAMIVVAVFSILYGSVLAFSQDNARLVVGYSSIAQLGFITLGIFSLDPKGAEGAVMQMLNHGLVVGPLFLIIAVIAQRANGSESLSELGGVAFRAPVLAAMFLLVTFATLAMPGSPNFIGELLILFGIFTSKLALGIVASAGVILASVYMIRIFQRTMHNRAGPVVASRDIVGCKLDLATIVPLVAVVVGLGVYPQAILHRSERSAKATVQQAVSSKQLAAVRGP